MKKGLIYGIVFMFFMIFGLKIILIYTKNNYYQEKLIEKTKIYVNGTSAPRGRILDVNGNVLVDNVGIKTIYYNKIKGVKTIDELNIAKKLVKIIDVEEANVEELKKYYLITNNDGKDLITEEEYELLNMRKINSDDIKRLKNERITEDMLEYDMETKKVAHLYKLMNTGYIYSKKEIKKNVSDMEYAKVIESNIEGVTGELSWERTYPYNETLKNILGSVGNIPKELKGSYLNKGYELTDVVGISYLEYQYDEYLQGTKARYLVNSDYTLKKESEEKRGNDLVLSIDINLQQKLDEIIKDKILLGQKYGNTEYYKDSYAIVSNPLTGEILAISGNRLNDDNTFSDVSLNTLTKSYTMGSSVKGATIAVGYKYNLITPGEYIWDSCVKLAHVPKKCSFKSLGKINDLTALANSSNYYQYLIAIKLTGNNYQSNIELNATNKHFEVYRKTLGEFGLGVKTGIDLPNEQTGIIGSKVSDDLLLNLAIGQYDTYTPLELLQYINSVASGKRMSLSLMNKIVDGNNIVLENIPKVLNTLDISYDDLNRIKEGLRLVLSEGTGKFYVPQGLNFAGKTGTSESFLDINNDNQVDVATISSTFAGFYPYDNPKYSLVVITPNVSHKEGKTDSFYFGASKITKDIVSYLENN